MPQQKRGRVLLVDDDPANRNLLRLQLEEQHFEVLTAASGEECLRLATEEAPEVVLLDIKMPGMDGIETCRVLKQTADTARIPVLFVTGRRDDEPTTVEALEAGGNDFLSKDASVAILVARVQTQLAIYRAQTKLRLAAMTDDLTGVYSRRFLFDTLRRAVKSLSRQGPKSVACTLIDVDRFKLINDAVGHIEGDRVLRTIAETINQATRETDLVARFGGDEFLVITLDAGLDAARLVAERVRQKVQTECGSVTLSIGVALLDSVTLDELRTSDGINKIVENLVERADRAMYRAKALGRNCVVVWTEDSGLE